MVWLDKTRIRRLVSFIAALKPVILTFNRLESFEVHYMIQILQCFHQKPSFLWDWRKKYINRLDDMGMS